ncbi:MAG: hypothetical protein LBQ68_07690, partial [Clostridiales bacterium]|nr:hypothetical protein [Clostridiales bacterium]
MMKVSTETLFGKHFYKSKWGFSELKYKNAKDVLPAELLDQLQQYIRGELLYIPQKEGKKAPWGQLTGLRKEVFERNKEIRSRFYSGESLYELSDIYCLSESS